VLLFNGFCTIHPEKAQRLGEERPKLEILEEKRRESCSKHQPYYR
jgi:hypothetical protein